MRFFLVLSAFLVGCIRPFDIESIEYSRVLAVDAVITDEVKAHQVSLTYSFPLNASQLEVVSGAEVWIETDQGDRTELTEQAPGKYFTPEDFRAEDGQIYTLQIQIDDRSYSSLPVAKRPPGTIENMYAEYINTETKSGIEIFLDADGAQCGDCYFKYTFEETYKIVTPLGSQFEYIPGEGVVPRTIPVNVCYIQDSSSNYTLGSNLGSSSGKHLRHLVTTLAVNSPKIRSRYSILAKQHSVSREAHAYYTKLKQNDESGGTLFDTQPGTIVGNIRSLDNSDELVLGYFDVSSVSTSRLFISPEEFFEDGFSRPEFTYDCPFTETTVLTDSADIAEFAIRFQSIYEIWTVQGEPIEGVPSGTHFAPRECTSCNWYADLTPPDFWIDQE